jgi:hypothetical protein
MSNAQSWYAQRRKKIVGLRGTYELEVPDILTLMQDWKDAGADLSKKEMDFALEVSKPEVMKKLLLKYVKDPPLSEIPKENCIFVDDLLKDQAETIIIYGELTKPLREDPEKIKEFFRVNFPARTDSGSRDIGSTSSPSTNRDTGDKQSESSREDTSKSSDSK